MHKSPVCKVCNSSSSVDEEVVDKNPATHIDIERQSDYETINRSIRQDSITTDGSKNFIEDCQEFMSKSYDQYQAVIAKVVVLVLFLAYTAYFAVALSYSVERATALIVLTSLGVTMIVYIFIRDHFGDYIYENFMRPALDLLDKSWPVLQWFFYPAIAICICVYLALDVVHDVRQLQSLSGAIFFTVLLYVTSKHPRHIHWTPVLWGFTMQFVLAILILRWRYGYVAVKFLADEITKFIEYGYEGEAVVFGDPFLLFHPVAFLGLPLLLYLGAVMAILYYFGITQALACKIAWLMQHTMKTTAIESLNVAANIFLDGMDTMLMLRQYLDKLTLSEFNCLMTANHATVAGFVFALFVLFGAPPQHLLSAAVMSAPATIAICKLSYPETEQSITESVDDIKLARGNDVNVFEAAANGAAVAGKTVAAVGGCYIAFLSMLAFINATLSYMGGLIGHSELSFELMCSYIMWPIAYIIGVEYDNCQEAAKLMGIKVFATEVLAYQELGKSVAAGLLSSRSEAIVTYAMCGFSSISTLAIAVGVWNAMCPQRVKLMVSMMFRVLCGANISCYMTACIAGLFYSDELINVFETPQESGGSLIGFILGLIPDYKGLMSLAGM